jgi:hypothetical protein
MSSISAGTSVGSALVQTGDTTGALQLQVNGTTPSITLAANGSIGVGSTPGYGTSGQVLTSAGTGSAPTWSAPASSAMVFLSTTTGTDAATIDVETTFDSTYNMYMLVGELVYPSTQYQYLLCRFKLGTYLSASYETVFQGFTGTSTSTGTTPSASTSGSVFYNLDNTAANSASFVMWIPFPSSLTRKKNVFWQGVAQQNGSTAQVQGIINQNDASSATTALTGLRFLSSSGNLNGTFRLYGIKNS